MEAAREAWTLRNILANFDFHPIVADTATYIADHAGIVRSRACDGVAIASTISTPDSPLPPHLCTYGTPVCETPAGAGPKNLAVIGPKSSSRSRTGARSWSRLPRAVSAIPI
ncbi:hypothetical protein GCM10011610_67470 [Nocardia rhizosphaerihabitans]|uniref:Uncharacterized protein n=1 Tax=Nocardia rhizosphaerihabitans TaxID=1691570 RepID=A0ABQ2L381_9NOCA|nr:hypothetical protein GCM10011610_67470 [Nocardia rhizosphaerihabitans]